MAIELSKKQIKDGWQIVKFGEIAKNISKRVEPSETDLEVYVGLEHLDPQSLRITRRGVPADVKGQKLRVRPGQIIFGKRRAYQKKVAVADFEGICSAHAMVLEEVVGKIIPGLLPFFMQSDMFMDRAVAISEGSLSPTIKWKTLAIQEFPLPPIERQKEILEVLEKLEENDLKVESLIRSITTLLKCLKIKISRGLSFNKKERELSKIKLSELCAINYGKSPAKIFHEDGKYNVWGTGGITGKTNEVLCEKSAVLLGRKGTIDSPQLICEPFWAIDTTFFCTPENSTSIEWLFWYLSSIDLKIYNEASGVPSLSRTTLNNIKVPLPSPEEQQEQLRIINRINELLHLKESSRRNLSSIRQKLLTHFISLEVSNELQ